MKKVVFMHQLICTLLCYGCQSTAWESIILPADFHQAMVSHIQDLQQFNLFLRRTPHKDLLTIIEDQYYKFVCSSKEKQSDLMFTSVREHKIPKIIHQIWIGPHPFPEEAREWQASWSKMHPDWEYKLWTNKEVEQLDFDNKQYFDEAKNWGEKADILRYEILYRFGGLYVDVDFECLKPFDWLHDVCDFYAGIHAVPLLFKHNLRINNGLIGARPGHPLMAYAREQLQYFRNKKDVAQRTGPDFFSQVIADILPASLDAGSVDMVFPSNFFYPSGPKGGLFYKIKAGEAFVQPETMAVHYYTAYWIRKPRSAYQASKMAESENQTRDYMPARCSSPERLAQRYAQYKAKQLKSMPNIAKT